MLVLTALSATVDAAPETTIPYGLTAWLLTQNDATTTLMLTQDDVVSTTAHDATTSAYDGSTCDAPAAI